MTFIPNQCFLDEMALSECQFEWPLFYRGTAHSEVIIYQPFHRYAELEALKKKGQVELKFVGKSFDGEKKEIVFKRVQVLDCYTENESSAGAVIVIADVRSRLRLYPFVLDINVMWQGVYVGGTAQEDGEPLTLLGLLTRLAQEAPFAELVKDLPAFALEMKLQDDLRTSGKAMVEGLQRVLEAWGVDLVVTPDGELMFVRRVSEFDPGAEQNIQKFRFKKRPKLQRKASIAGRIFVPFKEKHCLQVPFISDFARGDTSDEKFVSPAAHGLWLQQGFAIMGTYMTLEQMLALFKKQGAVQDRYLATGNCISQNFMKPYFNGTELTLDGVTDALERKKRFTLTQAIKKSTRHCFLLRFDSHGASGWINMQPGKLLTSGDVVPYGVEGSWAELYGEKSIIEDENGEYITLQRRTTMNNLIAIYRQHRISEPGVFNSAELTKEQIESVREAVRNGQLWINQGEVASAPFKVRFDPQLGVVLLEPDEAHLNQGSTAIMGVVSGSRLYAGNVNIKDALEAPRETDPEKKQLSPYSQEAIRIYGDALEDAVLTLQMSKQDLQFDPDYKFWAYFVAERNSPQNYGKYFIVEIPAEKVVGKDVEVTDEYMILEPPADIYALRQYKNYAEGEVDPRATAPSKKSEAAPLRHWIEGDIPPNLPGFGEQDNLGSCMNLAELRLEALRMASNVYDSLRGLAGPSVHPYVYFWEVPDFTAIGNVDSMSIVVQGKRISGNMAMVPRKDDFTRLATAMTRNARRPAEFSGKIIGDG